MRKIKAEKAVSHVQKVARLIAYYLPQYHPNPDNDRWWGKGFTEWTNVAKAKQMFAGHYQPNIPADLGFYDLRVPEARHAQAELAREYGIEGFCYYHYWFSGKLYLERPFNEILESGEPDFPFCLCWANHSWTGIWSGEPHRVLIEQEYPGMEDHKRHFEWLLSAFRDARYITVDDRPLFMVYHPMDIPEIERVTDLWRSLAYNSGLPGLYLIGVNKTSFWNPHKHGFDASVTEPFPELTGRITWEYPIAKISRLLHVGKSPTVHSYKRVLPLLLDPNKPNYQDFPCVLPNWDNTPRSGSNGVVLHGSTPDLFRKLLRTAIARVSTEREEERIILLKAWNEWAEGNYVEPDLRFGRGYLEVIRQEVCNCNENKTVSKMKNMEFENLYNTTESAAIIIPIVLKLFPTICSVVDFGCGEGEWLKTFKDNGIEEILGLDIEYTKDLLFKHINKDEFKTVDLEQPVFLDKTYDLVVSLEVAEHISEPAADTFVQSLANAGKIILFSAAIPGQGGLNHINEQFPSYWTNKFQKHGYNSYDIIRRKIWNNADIDPWYRQNIFLIVHNSIKVSCEETEILPLIHPDMYKRKKCNCYENSTLK